MDKIAENTNKYIEIPCNVGESVWFATYGEHPIQFTVTHVSLEINSTGIHWLFYVVDEFGNSDYFHGEAIGKTVFLNSKEAEEKMKGVSNG